MALTEKLTAIADAIRVQSGKSDKLTLDQMPSEIIDLQALGFEIVGNPQPSNPKANTIWIDTDTEITSWIFSTTQPNTAAEGMVWIYTDTKSSAKFNALKKNCITVYPMSSRQYVNGEWVTKTAKSYQAGKWSTWTPEGALYYFGDVCADESGGWNARGWRIDSTYSGTVVPTITNHDDHMEIIVPSANIAGGAVEVNANQDLTNVNSIAIDFEMTINEYNVQLMVINRSAATMDEAARSVSLNGSVLVGTFSRRTITLDVSALSGFYDVAIRFADQWAGSKPDGVNMKVYSVIKNSESATTDGVGIVDVTIQEV